MPAADVEALVLLVTLDHATELAESADAACFAFTIVISAAVPEPALTWMVSPLVVEVVLTEPVRSTFVADVADVAEVADVAVAALPEMFTPVSEDILPLM
jgi:hypothetical protein